MSFRLNVSTLSKPIERIAPKAGIQACAAHRGAHWGIMYAAFIGAILFVGGVSTLSAQTLYVSCSSGILRYNGATGAIIDTFASAPSESYYGFTFGPDGNLYSCEWAQNRVVRYNGATGAPMPSPGNTGATFVSSQAGGLSQPHKLAFGTDGKLYVGSVGTVNGVQRYNGTLGTFDTTFTTTPPAVYPYAITFKPDSTGDLYVTSEHNILRYDRRTGRPIPGTGAGAGIFATDSAANTHYDLTFGPDGNLYVTAFETNKVLRFNGTTGASMGDFVTAGSGGLDGPMGLAFGPDSNLYVVSARTNQILKYSGSSGAFVGSFTSGTLPAVPRYLHFLEPSLEFNVTPRYIDGCCFEFDLQKKWGGLNNIVIIDAEILTPGVAVASASDDWGGAPTTTPTSIRWTTATPGGLDKNKVPSATVQVCFANANGPVQIRFTPKDANGSTFVIWPDDYYHTTVEVDADCGPDLYMQDSKSDNGDEPNTQSGSVLWASDDIWVRTSQGSSGGHVNPVYNPTSPNYVYVRVRNRGAHVGTGTVHLYWAKAAVSLNWGADWNGANKICGQTGSGELYDVNGVSPVVTVQPGPTSVDIAEFIWYPADPNAFACFTSADKHHFCLLARIEESTAPPFGMTYPETYNVWENTNNNNNIAWKNVSVVDTVTTPSTRTGVLVRGSSGTHGASKRVLRLQPLFDANRRRFTDFGTIVATLDDRLYARWIGGGRLGAFDSVNDQTRTIRFASADAWIGGLILDPDSAMPISVSFDFDKFSPADTATFNVDLIQSWVEGDSSGIDGGERFIVQFQRAVGGASVSLDSRRRTLDLELVSPRAPDEPTNVRITMPSTSTARLVLCDMLRNEIRTVMEGELTIGQHVVPCTFDGVSAGAYLLLLANEGAVVTRPITIVR